MGYALLPYWVQGGNRIKLGADYLQPMMSTRITVEWPALPIETSELELTLEGSEMMMGVYRLKLTRNISTMDFSGDVMLPFCVSDSMTWQGAITPIDRDTIHQPLHVSLRMIK